MVGCVGSWGGPFSQIMLRGLQSIAGGRQSDVRGVGVVRRGLGRSGALGFLAAQSGILRASGCHIVHRCQPIRAHWRWPLHNPHEPLLVAKLAVEFKFKLGGRMITSGHGIADGSPALAFSARDFR